jgi:hypothetical protein
MLKKKTKLKALSLALLFVMVFTAIVSLTTNEGKDIYAASRKNSQYSLAGAEYTLFTDAGCNNVATDADGNPAVLTTDANGNTSELAIEPGTYWAKETKASPGYMFDVDDDGVVNVRKITVTENNVSGSPASFTSTEPPAYGIPNFKLYKIDKSGKYGWKQLLGAEYTVKYYDVATKDAISEDHLMDTWTFTTKKMEFDAENSIYYAGFDFTTDTPTNGADFYKVNGKRVMPLGWFTIQETKAPNGLSLSNEIFYGQVTQESNGAEGSTYINNKPVSKTDPYAIEAAIGVYAQEEPQAVTIKINKQAQQNDVQLVSSASLAGAKYEVYYDDPDNTDVELVGTITTDENGAGELTKREAGDQRKIGDPLDAGDYYIKEVTPSPGFLLDKYRLAADGKTTELFEGSLDVIVGYESDGTPVTKTVKGTYGDGQALVKARVQATNTASFTYTVPSYEAATETHIKKTDATTTKELPGATIQIIDKNGAVVEEWVSTTEEHIVYGLTAGETYTLREITAPYGYDIAEDIEFTVSDSEIVNKVEMQDKPITVGTTATDKATDSHHGIRSEEDKIIDTVKVTGLTVGRKYNVTGKLYNTLEKDFVKGADGEVLTAESGEFEATAETMEVEVTFTVDSSKFKDKVSLVAYEYLTRVEALEGRDEEVPKELAKHEDPEDEEQTIRYGGIVRTVATDKASLSHNLLGTGESEFRPNATIVDKVYYENLSTETTYDLSGVIFDKTTGQLTNITATTKFKPAKSSGYVELAFTFDAAPYRNHDLVVYETLLVNNKTVDEHKNPDDEEQTIHVPEIATTVSSDIVDGYVTDTVYYKNLIPGKTYVMNAYAVKASNGAIVKGFKGNAVFMATAKDGTIDVKLKDVKNSGDVVIFEECYIINDNGEQALVGEHKDLNDEAQLLEKPKSGHPSTGDDNKIAVLFGIFTALAAVYVALTRYIKSKKKEDILA